MDEREPGPLEQEIEGMTRQAALAEPLALEALTGEVDLSTLASTLDNLSREELLGLVMGTILRFIPAQKRVNLRLAQEIDAIKASADSRE